MNDYAFGNKLYDLRKQSGRSQSELAQLLGVSNKAVSKWENGQALPRTEILRTLAALYDMSLDDLLQIQDHKEKQIHKIVITGGPCAGKTTAMSWIANAFEKRGYTVLFINETATELISGGVAPWTMKQAVDYQKCQMKLQLEKEAVFMQAAQYHQDDKILLVCDRGAIDNKAYMSESEFALVLQSLGLNEVELRDQYDGIFHLVSAAKGAEEFYTTANNQARTESVEQAAALDDALIAAWTGHPHLRIIDNRSDFKAKMQRLIQEIAVFLGIPEPYEIERKFLIDYPDIKQLEQLSECTKVEIIQTYLRCDGDEEVRIRQRGLDGHYVYYETRKRNISDLKRVEVERRLTQKEYLRMLMEADPQKRPIRKDRYMLTYDNHYYEIDVYPFWKDQAILEIELADENETFDIPDMFHVIKEVTNDPQFKNAALATIY